MSGRREGSLRSIAQELGVSVATVSRVLNGDPKVRDLTRERVMERLRFYHYDLPDEEPGREAQRTPVVGILCPTLRSDYFRRLQEQVEEFLAERGIRCITVVGHGRQKETAAALQTLYDCGVSGVILLCCSRAALAGQLRSGVAQVWIDCNDDPGECEDLCQVQSDHYVAGKMAATELLRSGSRHPIIVTGGTDTHRMRERNRGFFQIYREAGIELQEESCVLRLRIQSDIFLQARELIRYLQVSGQQFDGIFAVGDLCALGAYLGCQGVGLQIPGQVRLVGFDGVSETARSIVSITSVMQDTRTISRSAGEMLLAQLQGREPGQRRVIVPVALYHGVTLPVSSLYPWLGN